MLKNTTTHKSLHSGLTRSVSHLENVEICGRERTDALLTVRESLLMQRICQWALLNGANIIYLQQPGGYTISQDTHEAIIRDHLKRLNVKVELGVELTAFEQDEGGVTATARHHLKQGSSQDEIIRTSYLVGTDGGRGLSLYILPSDVYSSLRLWSTYCRP